MQNSVIPALYCPFPSQINPHVTQAQSALSAWVRRLNMLPNEHAYAKFDSSKFAYLFARDYPFSSAAGLQFICDFGGWLFVLDDQCDEAGIGQDPVKLRAAHARHIAILQGAAATVADWPIAHALQDFRDRIGAVANAAWMQRFVRRVGEYFESCVWEAENRAQGIVPDSATYMRMRLFTGAVYICTEMIEITDGIDLPDDVRTHAVLQTLTVLTNAAVCWGNDLRSYFKESNRGDVHNLVAILQHERQIDLQTAINAVAAMHDAEVRAFIRLAAQVPTFGPELDPRVQKYVNILSTWIRGNYDWSQETGRYAWREEALAPVGASVRQA